MLSAFERRYEILKVLFQRRFETVTNLAFEFGVSKNTVYRDIDMLSVFPIYTVQGNGGGVYVIDGAKFGARYLTEEEELLLKKLMPQLSDEDNNVMQTILDKFSTPKKRLL